MDGNWKLGSEVTPDPQEASGASPGADAAPITVMWAQGTAADWRIPCMWCCAVLHWGLDCCKGYALASPKPTGLTPNGIYNLLHSLLLHLLQCLLCFRPSGYKNKHRVSHFCPVSPTVVNNVKKGKKKLLHMGILRSYTCFFPSSLVSLKPIYDKDFGRLI